MSIEYELMDFTMELARAYSIDPFHILAQEKDNVFLLVNYYIEKPVEKPKPKQSGNRRLVNDKTATNNWF